jgi:hypothetical protein
MIDGRACYEFDAAKKLIQVDADFDTLLKKDAITGNMLTELKESVKQYQLALDAEKSATTILTTNGKQLSTKLLAETDRANKAEAKTGLGSAWIVGGGAVLLLLGVAGGVVLGVYVSKK